MRREKDVKRTTIIMSQALHQNLSIFAVQNRMSFNDAVIGLVVKSLTMEGFQPEKIPSVKITYNK